MTLDDKDDDLDNLVGPLFSFLYEQYSHKSEGKKVECWRGSPIGTAQTIAVAFRTFFAYAQRGDSVTIKVTRLMDDGSKQGDQGLNQCTES